MNPIVFALRHPITMMMIVVALIGGGSLALTKMRVDIFPPLNLPRIYVYLQYGGMSPYQMEGLIVNQFELYFQYVDGVSAIESHSIQQCAMVKLSFFQALIWALLWPKFRRCHFVQCRKCPLELSPFDHAYGCGVRAGWISRTKKREDTSWHGG